MMHHLFGKLFATGLATLSMAVPHHHQQRQYWWPTLDNCTISAQVYQQGGVAGAPSMSDSTVTCAVVNGGWHAKPMPPDYINPADVVPPCGIDGSLCASDEPGQ